MLYFSPYFFFRSHRCAGRYVRRQKSSSLCVLCEREREREFCANDKNETFWYNLHKIQLSWLPAGRIFIKLARLSPVGEAFDGDRVHLRIFVSLNCRNMAMRDGYYCYYVFYFWFFHHSPPPPHSYTTSLIVSIETRLICFRRMESITKAQNFDD